MAIQTVKYGFPFPNYPPGIAAVPALGSATYDLDANAEKAAAIYMATAAKNIHKVHIRMNTTTVGDTLDVRIETVDTAANGDPTGTLWAVNTNASLVLAGSDDAIWKSVTLTADATLAVGDIYAIVLVQGASGDCLVNNFSDQTTGFPYGDAFTASWTKNISPPMMFAEFSDGSFEPVFGISDVGALINSNSFDNNDATNKRGNIFSLPFPARAAGAWAWVDADATFTIVLYDTDGTTPLATTPATNAFQRATTAGNPHFYAFLVPVELDANTDYYMAVVPQSTTALTLYDFDVPAAGMLDMFPGGQDCHRAVYTSSAWVPTTTSRSFMGIYLDGFSDGAGGAPYHGAMSGGML